MDVQSDSGTITLFVSLCVLLDVGRRHYAVCVGGQGIWQCTGQVVLPPTAWLG